jgi:hypothetical protein
MIGQSPNGGSQTHLLFSQLGKILDTVLVGYMLEIFYLWIGIWY